MVVSVLDAMRLANVNVGDEIPELLNVGHVLKWKEEESLEVEVIVN